MLAGIISDDASIYMSRKVVVSQGLGVRYFTENVCQYLLCVGGQTNLVQSDQSTMLYFSPQS